MLCMRVCMLYACVHVVQVGARWSFVDPESPVCARCVCVGARWSFVDPESPVCFVLGYLAS